MDPVTAEPRSRVVPAELEPLFPTSPGPATAMTAATAAPARAEVLRRIDEVHTAYAELAVCVGWFGPAHSDGAELIGWRRGEFTGVRAAVAPSADRLERSLPGAAPKEERFRLRHQAGRLVSTALTGPRPERPALLPVPAVPVTRRRKFTTGRQARARSAGLRAPPCPGCSPRCPHCCRAPPSGTSDA